MKIELTIPNSLGFCKNCFNRRRDGSAYCGTCEEAKPRLKVYSAPQDKFPLLDKVKKIFPIDHKTIFTHGDTIYHNQPLSFDLIRHELTHVFQQTKMGPKIWWDKYLIDEKFRIEQEVEAYQNQYQCMVVNKPKRAEELLELVALDMSSKLYGKIINFEEAKKLIKQ